MQTSAIPTVYRGIQMRSRAEARWAAFFDMSGWRWTYEPVDLPGYIPDFILHGDAPVLVEIKGGAMRDVHAWDDSIEAEVRAKFHGERPLPLLLLGMAPSEMQCGVYEVVGSLLHPDEDEWDSAFLFESGLHRPYPDDRDRDYGTGIGTSRFSTHRPYPWSDYGEDSFGNMPRGSISRRWAEACNLTQWRRP